MAALRQRSGSLASLTTNLRPDLLPREAVHDAYRAWMGDAEEDTWVDLRDSTLRKAIDPASVPRLESALADLRTAMQGSSNIVEAIGQYLAAKKNEGARLSTEDRRRIFEI